MPIEIGLWKTGNQLEPARFQPLEKEKNLEARWQAERFFRTLFYDTFE